MNCDDCWYNLPKDGHPYYTYEEDECVKISALEKENAELKDKLESAEEMIEEIVANKAVIKVYNPYTDDGTVKSLEIALNHWLQRAEQFLKEIKEK